MVLSDSLEGGGAPGLDELGFWWSWFPCDLHVAASLAPGPLALRVCVQGSECGESKAELESSKLRCPCWIL